MERTSQTDVRREKIESSEEYADDRVPTDTKRKKKKNVSSKKQRRRSFLGVALQPETVTEEKLDTGDELSQGEKKRMSIPRLGVPAMNAVIGLKFSPRGKRALTIDGFGTRDRSFSSPPGYKPPTDDTDPSSGPLVYSEKTEGLEVVRGVDGKEECKAGSLGKIVEWLLNNSDDPFCLEVLIIAYRQFVSPLTFFNILLPLYPNCIQASEPGCMTPKLVRFLQMLRLWIGKYLLRDFLANNEKGLRLFDSLFQFMHRLSLDGFSFQANELKLLMLRAKSKRKPKPKLQTVLPGLGRRHFSSAELIRRESFSEALQTFAELQPLEVADVMATIEFNIFRKIKETEFLNLSWKRRDGNAKHIKKLVNRSNRVSFWVATTIVSSKDMSNRISLLKRFLVVAERCRELRNYNSLMAVLGGLNLYPVSRLRKTWEGLPEKYKELFKELSALMDNKQNYSKYREALLVPPPEGLGTIPYLGVCLRDLVFVEEGNETVFENGLINYEKVQLVGKLILEVQRFQEREYQLGPCPSEMLKSYIKHLAGEDERRLDELSLLCEPLRSVSTAVAASPPGSPTSSSRQPQSPRLLARRGGEELIENFEAAYFTQPK